MHGGFSPIKNYMLSESTDNKVAAHLYDTQCVHPSSIITWEYIDTDLSALMFIGETLRSNIKENALTNGEKNVLITSLLLGHKKGTISLNENAQMQSSIFSNFMMMNKDDQDEICQFIKEKGIQINFSDTYH